MTADDDELATHRAHPLVDHGLGLLLLLLVQAACSYSFVLPHLLPLLQSRS